ncbi:hypothetical protein HD806DRAFT_114701 [Xylariaceae sp. AK1471]|nr:hypothetical protein HD806DRAFT_114701 [Xylariaceae sp. AK1471]
MQRQLQYITTDKVASYRITFFNLSRFCRSSHSPVPYNIFKMPITNFKIPRRYSYRNGSNPYHKCVTNHPKIKSEAIPGSLPTGANLPPLIPYGLYAEKLSGTAFTALSTRTYSRGYTASSQLPLTPLFSLIPLATSMS